MSNLNLKYYKNIDESAYYSLKELDKETIKLLNSVEVPETAKKIPQDVLYFFNPKKENLLNWYNFNKDANVLVINDCSGYISSSICNKVHSLDIVEASKPLAEILNNKFADKKNVEIIVGNLFDIPSEKQYDYVVLADSLNVLPNESNENNQYHNILEKVKSFLKPEAKLILAVSNRFGLKNWAGAIDESYGTTLTGLRPNDFKNIYIKKEYENILKMLRFENLEFYYPVPSHFSPDVVVSQDDLKNTSIENYFQNYALYNNKLFHERMLVKELVEVDKFDLFANSFLIFATNKKNGEKGE